MAEILIFLPHEDQNIISNIKSKKPFMVQFLHILQECTNQAKIQYNNYVQRGIYVKIANFRNIKKY